jgi:sugar-specific transcriptional regulator TrmB
MKLDSVLFKLGFSRSEIRVYSAILRSGLLGVSAIARETGLYRPTIYRVLSLLKKKKIIKQSVVGKRAVYAPERPFAIDSMITDTRDELHKLLPELTRLYEHSQSKPQLFFYSGKQGILHAYQDLVQTVKKGDVIYRYESPRDYKKNKRYYPKIYMNKLGRGQRSDIEKFVITNKKTHEGRSEQLERLSKPVPPSSDLFEYDVTQIIYGNKVLFIDYNSKTAAIIENESIAKFQMKIFKILFSYL